MPDPKHSQGLSLAELLIVMALVGLIMIPSLFVGSAYFSAQLVRSRQDLSLSHNASMMARDMLNSMGRTPALIAPTTAETFTTADELRLSYYDPIQEAVMYEGYRLSDSSGRRILEKLSYESGTWTAYSPYGTKEATDFTLTQWDRI